MKDAKLFTWLLLAGLIAFVLLLDLKATAPQPEEADRAALRERTFPEPGAAWR
jgi:hypothetical protein